MCGRLVALGLEEESVAEQAEAGLPPYIAFASEIQWTRPMRL